MTQYTINIIALLAYSCILSPLGLPLAERGPSAYKLIKMQREYQGPRSAPWFSCHHLRPSLKSCVDLRHDLTNIGLCDCWHAQSSQGSPLEPVAYRPKQQAGRARVGIQLGSKSAREDILRSMGSHGLIAYFLMVTSVIRAFYSLVIRIGRA